MELYDLYPDHKRTNTKCQRQSWARIESGKIATMISHVRRMTRRTEGRSSSRSAEVAELKSLVKLKKVVTPRGCAAKMKSLKAQKEAPPS